MTDAENEQMNTESPDSPPIPLSFVRNGQEVELVAVRGGHGMQHRLAEMGLLPGARFTVLARGLAGPCIIRYQNARLMLGQGMVPRIMVRPVRPEPKTKCR